MAAFPQNFYIKLNCPGHCVERNLSDYWHALCSPYMNLNKPLESLTIFVARMIYLTQEGHRMHVLFPDRLSSHILPCLWEVCFSPLGFLKSSSVAVVGGYLLPALLGVSSLQVTSPWKGWTKTGSCRQARLLSLWLCCSCGQVSATNSVLAG